MERTLSQGSLPLGGIIPKKEFMREEQRPKTKSLKPRRVVSTAKCRGHRGCGMRENLGITEQCVCLSLTLQEDEYTPLA